eukprot:g6402.t1
MEQVFLAAAELGCDDWRDWVLECRDRARACMRVGCHSSFKDKYAVCERLKGIEKECQGEWKEAEKIYQKILSTKPEDWHPEDTLAHKRLIAMYKQQSGKVPEAIESINKYLETFSTDSEAGREAQAVWHELGELYIEVGHLQRAAFCFEELIVHNPRSMYTILTYAELLYSTGDFEASRKYFSMASYLDETNLRALWGLATCNMALAEKDKARENGCAARTIARATLPAPTLVGFHSADVWTSVTRGKAALNRASRTPFSVEQEPYDDAQGFLDFTHQGRHGHRIPWKQYGALAVWFVLLLIQYCVVRVVCQLQIPRDCHPDSSLLEVMYDFQVMFVMGFMLAILTGVHMPDRFAYLFCFSRPKPRGWVFLAVMLLIGPAWGSLDHIEVLSRTANGRRGG